MPPPIEPERRQAIADAVQAGQLSRNAIARQHGVTGATVGNIAREHDITPAFDRTLTKQASAARAADMAEARSRLRARLLAKAEDLLDQMDDPHLVYSFGGKDNEYNEHTLERAPTGDLRNLMTAAAIALDKHVVLDKHDSDDGHEDAKSMLLGVAEGLRAVYEQGRVDETPSDLRE